MPETPKCKAPGCEKDADYEVILYDFYPYHDVFFKRDFTYPFLCDEHMVENEREAKTYEDSEMEKRDESEFVTLRELTAGIKMVPAGTKRQYRGGYEYPYTNKEVAQGFSVYRPLSKDS